MTGAERIAAERARQVAAKGYTPERDDRQTGYQLTECAHLILQDLWDDMEIDGFEADDSIDSPVGPGPDLPAVPGVTDGWPARRADHVAEKYGADYRRRLVIAGALIAAEIDRLDRLAAEAGEAG